MEGQKSFEKNRDFVIIEPVKVEKSRENNKKTEKIRGQNQGKIDASACKHAIQHKFCVATRNFTLKHEFPGRLPRLGPVFFIEKALHRDDLHGKTIRRRTSFTNAKKDTFSRSAGNTLRGSRYSIGSDRDRPPAQNMPHEGLHKVRRKRKTGSASAIPPQAGSLQADPPSQAGIFFHRQVFPSQNSHFQLPAHTFAGANLFRHEPFPVRTVTGTGYFR